MSALSNPATSNSLTSSLATLGSSGSASSTKQVHDLKDLDLNQFLKLMISELQNQDPLNPLDNTQFVQQIGELRSIAASDQLSSTLQAVQTQQSLTTASSLIGKQVTALTADNQNISGTVSSVSVEVDPNDNTKRTYKVKIGDQAIDLANVREVE